MSNLLKDKKVILYIVMILGIFFFIFTIFSNKISFSESLTNGNSIIENGFSNTNDLTIHEDIPIVNYTWLYDVFIAFLYKNGGYLLIRCVFSIIATILFSMIFYMLLKKKISCILAFGITILNVVFVKDCLYAGTEIIIFLLLIFEIIFIEKLIVKKCKKYIIYLSIIPIIITNINGKMLYLYFLIYLPYIIEYLLYRLKIVYDKNNNIENDLTTQNIGKIYAEKIEIKDLIGAIIISSFTALISPSFINVYTYIYKYIFVYLDNFFYNTAEPIAITKNLIFLFMLVLYLFIIIIKDVKIRAKDYFMITLFLILPFIIDTTKIGIYLLFPLFFTSIIIENITKIISVKKKHTIVVNTCIILVFLSLLTINTFSINKSIENNDELEDAIKSIGKENVRIINSVDLADDLVSKKMPVYMYYNPEKFSKIFSKSDVMKDYYNVKNGNKNIDDIVEKYELTHIIAKKGEELGELIKYNEKYSVIFNGKNVIVYKVNEVY